VNFCMQVLVLNSFYVLVEREEKVFDIWIIYPIF